MVRCFLSQYHFFHHRTRAAGAEPSPCQAPAWYEAAAIWGLRWHPTCAYQAGVCQCIASRWEKRIIGKMIARRVCVNEQKRDEGLGGLRLLSWEKAEKLLKREWDFREGGFLYI